MIWPERIGRFTFVRYIERRPEPDMLEMRLECRDGENRNNHVVQLVDLSVAERAHIGADDIIEMHKRHMLQTMAAA